MHEGDVPALGWPETEIAAKRRWLERRPPARFGQHGQQPLDAGVLRDREGELFARHRLRAEHLRNSGEQRLVLWLEDTVGLEVGGPIARGFRVAGGHDERQVLGGEEE